MLSRLRRIARLFRRRGSAERGAQPVRLLLQRRFEGAESFFCHTALEQHRAIKLARRYGDAGSDRMLLGLVLGFGGGAHRRKRILVFAFRIEHPGGGDLPLDVHLLGPVGVLGLTQLVAQFSELGDLGLRVVRLAGARRPESSGEVRHGFSVRQRGRPDRKLRRRVPISPLERVPCRTHSQRIGSGNERLGEPADPAHLLDGGLRLRILPPLQIGIDEVIHGVQLVMAFIAGLCGARGLGVGADRFLPVADTGEDMGRHVLRVRRCRRDLRIALGGIKAFLRQCRRIVEMDQVVGDAGMARLTQKDRLENGRALELHRIGLIARRCRHIELDCVKYLGFVVIRISLRHPFHGLEVGEHAAAMINLVVVGIERGHRIDEIALALRLRANRLALLDRCKAKRKVVDRRRGVRIVEKAQGNAPIRDTTGGIGLEHFLVKLLRLAIPERMLVTHGAIEAPLRNISAGRLEMNGT